VLFLLLPLCRLLCEVVGGVVVVVDCYVVLLFLRRQLCDVVVGGVLVVAVVPSTL